MVNGAGLRMCFDAWLARSGYTMSDIVITEGQIDASVFIAGLPQTEINVGIIGQMAFVHTIEVQNDGPPNTVPAVVSVTGATYRTIYREWLPGITPDAFLPIICLADEFIKIQIDNASALLPNCPNLSLFAHYMLVTPMVKRKEQRVKLV